MFITESKFIDNFNDTNETSYSEFIKKAKVKSKIKTYALTEYIKEKDMKKGDFKQLYNHYKNKDSYLHNFFTYSMKIPEVLTIVEPPMKTKMNNNENTHYKNVIRNMHYKDILKNTQSGFNNPSYLKVLEDFYNKEILDYNLVIPSALEYINNNQIGSVFSSLYFRASIMNPYLVYSLNKSILKGKRIFTPTLGWTSYCYGFLECNEVEEYVGTDVIPSVCSKTKKFANKYYSEKKCDIFCVPSESLLLDKSFIEKYANHFDVVFFSPPYYKLEIYKGGKQSVNEYKSYEEWLHEYWENTVQLIKLVLINGGTLCYILSGYGSDLQHDLVKDMNSITSKYFRHFKTINMNNQTSNKRHRETNEQIFIFKNV